MTRKPENTGNSGAAPLESRGRIINYLRVSITDRCNMRCVYCIPDDVKFLPAGEILTYEEIERAVRIAVGAGIRKVRLTGGEPLARSGVEKLIAGLSRIEGIEDLSLTTNGLLLAARADELAAAGLHRVNVSLDTLDPEKFRGLCRAGGLEEVLNGIRAAKRAGLGPVKVNVVVMRGRNESEIADFIAMSAREGVIARFIEYMPISLDEDWERLFVPRDEMMAPMRDSLTPRDDEDADPASPARYFNVSGAGALVGFISPVSHGFCAHCNRLRLTPDGRLLSCLLSDASVDIKNLLRSGRDDTSIERAFRAAAGLKGEKGSFNVRRTRRMHSIGG